MSASSSPAPRPGKTLYEKVFCAHGAAEGLIKDMKRFTRSDKAAYSGWQANQFRLFLLVGAYWLLHSRFGGKSRRIIVVDLADLLVEQIEAVGTHDQPIGELVAGMAGLERTLLSSISWRGPK